jgi:ubiquinone/menaquinone biosynthesis C-methylase UbiE
MADRAYLDPSLAAVYDCLNPLGEDTAFYMRLARPRSRILDIGCGTGSLALALAAEGHVVTGVDPSPGMLSIARGKDEAGRVRWIEAMGHSFAADAPFNLAVMTGHVFQVFLDDETTLATLNHIRQHLGPEGLLAFESRNPDCREWEHWTRSATRQLYRVPGIGQVAVHYQVVKADEDKVFFETVFHFVESGRREVSFSTLRFPRRDQVASLLEQAGYGQVEWRGDWHGSSLSADSREMIVLARR